MTRGRYILSSMRPPINLQSTSVMIYNLTTKTLGDHNPPRHARVTPRSGSVPHFRASPAFRPRVPYDLGSSPPAGNFSRVRAGIRSLPKKESSPWAAWNPPR